MRKRLAYLVVALTIALGAAGSSPQASVAAPSENAVCITYWINLAINEAGGKGFAHFIVVPDAHDGGSGDVIAPRASSNDCPEP